MAKAKPSASGLIELNRLQDKVVGISIVGTAGVIPHRWSEKARRMMPGHPESHGKVKERKGAKNPEEDADGCLYKLDDGRLGIPAAAFKSAIVGACRFFDKPSMVECKLLVYVEGEGIEQLIPIDFKEKVLREDIGRNANGSCELRYRYELMGWSATLRARFISSCLSEDSVVALVDAAGRLGVGDWRPSAPKVASGTHGT